MWETGQQSENVFCLSLGQGPFYQVDDFLTFSLPWEQSQASSGSQAPWRLTCVLLSNGFPKQTEPCCCLLLSRSLCWEWRLHSWSARDSGAKSLIYSAGTAGHLSCNKNKMSLWPRACNLLLNPHFKESYYTRVRLNQTKLQCLRTVAHFQILLYLTTSPSETQLGAEQNDPMII